MSVTFAVPAPYRKATRGQAEIELPAGTVSQAIAALTEQYPDMARRLLTADGRLNPYASIYVNGEHVHGEGALDRVLHDGDRLLVMPVIGGGC